VRKWIGSHLTFANAVSLAALFIALGGTTYAATGGNFILGQSNGAGAPTMLTSGTTNDAGTLKVTNSATSGGRAIQGTANTGQRCSHTKAQVRRDCVGSPFSAP
jgi:hypothetical protein